MLSVATLDSNKFMEEKTFAESLAWEFCPKNFIYMIFIQGHASPLLGAF